MGSTTWLSTRSVAGCSWRTPSMAASTSLTSRPASSSNNSRDKEGSGGSTTTPDRIESSWATGTGAFCNVFEGESYELLKSISLGVDADNVRYNPRTNGFMWSTRIRSCR